MAAYFRNDPWIIGYDPMNEPFSWSLLDVGHRELDAQLECFYTGHGRPGRNANLHLTVACPADDPTVGLVPTIEANDPNHLIFYEPDIFTRHGIINYVGPMDFPHLVFNFHAYCPQRSGVTGDPTNIAASAKSVSRNIKLTPPNVRHWPLRPSPEARRCS